MPIAAPSDRNPAFSPGWKLEYITSLVRCLSTPTIFPTSPARVTCPHGQQCPQRHSQPRPHGLRRNRFWSCPPPFGLAPSPIVSLTKLASTSVRLNFPSRCVTLRPP